MKFTMLKNKIQLHLHKIFKVKNFKNYIEKNKNRFINELFELLRIPSVSAKSEHDSDVRSAAELIKKHFI